MDLSKLLVAILCTNSLVEILRHAHWLSDWRVFWNTTPHFRSRLLRCGFCSSYWAAGLTTLFLVGPAVVFP
jgi:hypothetical protein